MSHLSLLLLAVGVVFLVDAARSAWTGSILTHFVVGRRSRRYRRDEAPVRWGCATLAHLGTGFFSASIGVLTLRDQPRWQQAAAADLAVAVVGAWLAVRAARAPLEPPRAELVETAEGDYRRAPEMTDLAPRDGFVRVELLRIAPGALLSALAGAGGVLTAVASLRVEDAANAMFGALAVTLGGLGLWQSARRWKVVKSVLQN
jgi:hypothetical protein